MCDNKQTYPVRHLLIAKNEVPYNEEYNPVDEIEDFSSKPDPLTELLSMRVDLACAVHSIREALNNAELKQADSEAYEGNIRKAVSDLIYWACKISDYAIEVEGEENGEE